jgi:hypothetical protein
MYDAGPMRRILWLAVFAGLAAVSPPAGPAKPTHAPPQQLGPYTVKQDVALHRTAETIQAHLLAIDDQSFGGLKITDDGAVEVSVVGTPTDALAAELAAASGVAIRTRAAANSYGSLTSLTRRIDDAADGLRQRGIDMSAWGPSVEDNAVIVHLRNYTQEQADAPLQQFAGEPVIVATGSLDVAPAGRS